MRCSCRLSTRCVHVLNSFGTFDKRHIKAIMCLEKGVATRDDIDKTMKLGMNHPMGPLQLGAF